MNMQLLSISHFGGFSSPESNLWLVKGCSGFTAYTDQSLHRYDVPDTHLWHTFDALSEYGTEIGIFKKAYMACLSCLL